jgi:RND family efflux transporter MFP subunit
MSEEVINLNEGFGGMQNDQIPAENNKNRRSGKRVWLPAIGIVILILLAAGIIPRLRNQAELRVAANKKENSTPSVIVVSPRKPEETSALSLPGTTQAIQETVISARTSGYVRRSLADIGDRVQEGQLLAEIDTPELDQQLAQARQELESARLEVKQAEQNVNRAEQDVVQVRQNLEQAQAELEQATAGLKQTKTNRDLAGVTLARSKNLVAQGIVPRQETDERQAEFDVREAGVGVSEANIRNRQANIRAAQATIRSKLSDAAGLKDLVEARRAQVRGQEANVARLVELQSFGSVTAPFSGVITARNVETGSLITPTGGTTGGNAANPNSAINGLFRLARVDSIRTFVNVPQSNLASISPGLLAEIHIREFPDVKFEGRVVRTANALDSASRTLPVEVLIPNDDFRILPGMYAEVKFNLFQAGSVVLVPSSAIIVRADGNFVATVTGDSTAHFKQIETGREIGKEIEVLTGLGGNERIVAIPVDGLQEGVSVNVAPAPETTEK